MCEHGGRENFQNENSRTNLKIHGWIFSSKVSAVIVKKSEKKFAHGCANMRGRENFQNENSRTNPKVHGSTFGSKITCLYIRRQPGELLLLHRQKPGLRGRLRLCQARPRFRILRAESSFGRSAGRNLSPGFLL